MNNFESLVEAMSRRDFLKPIKKSNKEPEQVQPTEPVTSKPSTKKPKGMTRRDFIKKTGGGSVLGALTPIDTVLQSWPNIMSQVASSANWKEIFNKELPEYIETVLNGGDKDLDVVGNYITRAIKNITPKNGEINLGVFSQINKIYPYLLNMWSYIDDKDIDLTNVIRKDGKQIKDILSKIPDNDKDILDFKNSFDSFLKNPHGDELPAFTLHNIWFNEFQKVLNYGFKYNLIDNKTLFKLDKLNSNYDLGYTQIENAIVERGLEKEFEKQYEEEYKKQQEEYEKQQENELKRQEEELKRQQEEELRKQQEEELKQEKKHEKRKYNKLAKSIDYSRMDKAGGAEDVGYAKYYEHMNTFDNLVNDILQEKKDRCYNRAVQAYGTKTSAYRSAAMVKCRKGKIWKKKK